MTPPTRQSISCIHGRSSACPWCLGLNAGPPRRPQPPLIDDGFLVEPEPLDDRIPHHPPHAPRPTRIGRYALILVLAVALAVLMLVALAIAAPRGAPQQVRPDEPPSRTASPAVGTFLGAPHIPGVAQLAERGSIRMSGRSEVPGSSPGPGGAGGAPSLVVSEKQLTANDQPETASPSPALYSASATWCAPTPTQCQGWAPPARLAAVNSFRFGDAPYWIRVWRGETFVDALVVSFCRCRDTDAAVDLSPAAFVLLAPLSRGRIAVEIEVLDWPGDSDSPPPNPSDERMRAEDRE